MLQPRITPAATRRRFLGGGLGIAGAVLLAACESQRAAPGAAPPAPAAPGAPKPAVKKPQGTVQFWQWGKVYNPGFTELVKAFNERNEGIKVDFLPSSGGYWNKLTAAIAGNVGPDVFLMNWNQRAWAAQGTIKEITSLVNRDKNAAADYKARQPAFDEWYTDKGKITGWPWDYSTIDTHFNVTHFRETGLKNPLELGEEWDWDHWLDYGLRLTRRGPTIAESRYGLYSSESVEGGYYNFVAANGGRWFKEDLKTYNLTAPEFVEAVQFCVDLIYKHQVSPSREQTRAAKGQNYRTYFHRGVITMVTMGDWNFLRNEKVEGFDWEVTFVPKNPRTGRTGSIANLRGLVVNSATKQLEPTWVFMKYMLTKNVQDDVARLFGEVPGRIDSALATYANPDRAGPPEGRRALALSVKQTTPLPIHDSAPLNKYYRPVQAAINDIFNGKINVRDGLQNAQDIGMAQTAAYR